MTNLEKLLQWGILDPYQLPLSSKGDFILHYQIARHKNPQNREKRQTYIATINIFYKDQLLVDNLINYTEFKESLRTFIITKGQFEDPDNSFFEKSSKTKEGTVSLQLLETNRYINDREARQMLSLLHTNLSRHSDELLVKKYRLDSTNFISSEKNTELGNPNLENTEVINFLVPKPDYK